MKKIIIKSIAIVFVFVIIHQVYWYFSLGGNLTIWINNQSEIKSINQVEIYLDDQLISEDNFTNDLLDYKSFTLNVSPGKHKISVKSQNKSLNQEHEFYSILMKRAIIQFSNDLINSNDNIEVKTEVFTENIISRKSID